MLKILDDKFADALSKELQKLSEEDKRFFNPHNFDIDSVKSLPNEKGNHYYLFYNEAGEFTGYGMLRTFGKHHIPTLGCLIWQQYRGRGNGTKLVKELLAEAKKLHYHGVRLRVSPDNKTAYNAYKKTGFKKMAKRESNLIWMEHII
jgi:ribosomal protein S18 acetylase RimI-like enzyme